MPPIIEIHKLGKKYSIAPVQRYLALRDVVSQRVKNIFTKNEKHSNEFWALQDINLEIERGERIGIIGRNGAGKSTLLKILSKITPPTTGEVKLRGRVASLLEVGTGFHPELTGRENIYLNGSILGLTKKEINKKLDEIIDFSGVEKFIDTPLKHYSSGMQLRLAFSVAAHLEPEILLIDEVLAVGDMEFQKKCLGKMEEISKGDGRTILFVSHNMAAINTFCEKTALLDYGRMVEFDKSSNVISRYVSRSENRSFAGFRAESVNNQTPIFIEEAFLINETNNLKTLFSWDEEIKIKIKIRNCYWNMPVKIGIAINDEFGKRVAINYHTIPINSSIDSLGLLLSLPKRFFTPNNYSLDLSILNSDNDVLDLKQQVLFFEIQKQNTQYEYLNYDYGYVNLASSYEISESNYK